MIDPEVARLRRLRGEALLVREIARTFESRQWATNEALLGRSARASWRIARLISGRLRGHPFPDYQRDAGAATHAAHRLEAASLAVINRSRSSALKALGTHVAALARQLEDAISLAWSSDFSDSLARCHLEIRSLAAALAGETRMGEGGERPTLQAAPSERVVDGIGTALEGDWPYLAF
jgi:hypothetical protein